MVYYSKSWFWQSPLQMHAQVFVSSSSLVSIHNSNWCVDSIKHKPFALPPQNTFYVKKFIYISNRFHNITVIRILWVFFFFFSSFSLWNWLGYIFFSTDKKNEIIKRLANSASISLVHQFIQSTMTVFFYIIFISFPCCLVTFECRRVNETHSFYSIFFWLMRNTQKMYNRKSNN